MCVHCGLLKGEHLAETLRCPGKDQSRFESVESRQVIQESRLAAQLTGGKLSGNHYYRVQVAEPMSSELQPYTAECADIIEALGMTFNEGEAFKALWRLAASRQGRGKPGNKAQYDADKVKHYGERVAVQVSREKPEEMGYVGPTLHDNCRPSEFVRQVFAYE